MTSENGAQSLGGGDSRLHPGELQPLSGGAMIDVQCCFACGEQHLGVALKPYTKPNPPFTHWFQCPNHGDPVGAAIFQSGNVTSELHRKAVQNIFQWQGKPCIFLVIGQDGDRIDVAAIREGFPISRLPEATSNIITAMERLAPKPDDSPLPRASDDFLYRLGVKRVPTPSRETIAVEEAPTEAVQTEAAPEA